MSQMWEAQRKENAVQIHILGLCFHNLLLEILKKKKNTEDLSAFYSYLKKPIRETGQMLNVAFQKHNYLIRTCKCL